jgi:hypothetical protein
VWTCQKKKKIYQQSCTQREVQGFIFYFFPKQITLTKQNKSKGKTQLKEKEKEIKGIQITN